MTLVGLMFVGGMAGSRRVDLRSSDTSCFKTRTRELFYLVHRVVFDPSDWALRSCHRRLSALAAFAAAYFTL